MCEGKTLEEMLDRRAGLIRTDGFFPIAVEDRRPWAYTIGLAETQDHPELLMAGEDLQYVGHLIGVLGDRVIRGETFEPGDVTTEHGHDLEFRSVHPVHLNHGLLNAWFLQYGRTPEIPVLDVVQVVFRDDRVRQPRLDQAWTTFGRQGPAVSRRGRHLRSV
jgi:hypothetical protein